MRYVYRVLSLLGGHRAQRVMGVATLAGLTATVVIGLFVVPPDATQGDVQRLMYVHVPAAWVAYLSFGVVFVASIAYLRPAVSNGTGWPPRLPRSAFSSVR